MSEPSLEEIAVEMALQGRTYSYIAKELGVPMERAWVWCANKVRAPRGRRLEAEKAIAGARLDRWVGVVDEIAEDCDASNADKCKAITTGVAIETRRARLYGLDEIVPEVVVDGSKTPAEALEAIKKLTGGIGPKVEVE